MTYSELLAAVDLFALEDRETAEHIRRLILSRDWYYTFLYSEKDRRLADYLPAHALYKSKRLNLPNEWVQVNWTPDPP